MLTITYYMEEVEVTTFGDRQVERSACKRKVRHASEGKAKAHKRHLEETSDEVLYTYACAFCHGYHVGHPMNKMKQQALERGKR
jgi:hypothetical protein